MTEKRSQYISQLRILNTYRALSYYLRVGTTIWEKFGLRTLVQLGISRICCKMPPNAQTDHYAYKKWINKFDVISDADRIKIRQLINEQPEFPAISLIIIIDGQATANGFENTIKSIFKQIYPKWEICIAINKDISPEITPKILDLDGDLRVKLAKCDSTSTSALWHSAFALAKGRFIAWIDQHDQLPEHALATMAWEVGIEDHVDIAYSDHDHIDPHGIRFSPNFKPQWNPEYNLSTNYLFNLVIYRRSLVELVGGVRDGFEGSEREELALRCISRTMPGRIRHVPFVLYHKLVAKKNYGDAGITASSTVKAIERHLEDREVAFISVVYGECTNTYRCIYNIPEPKPLVSVIIPTCNGYDVLRRCIDSIKNTTYPYFETVIVDNMSSEIETIRYLDELRIAGSARILSYPKQFNYSAINNYAVEQVNGSIIALLNNDVEVINPEWLTEMVSHAVRPSVGAVGAMLYYPNGLVQHGGVILGIDGAAGHSHKHGRQPGYFERLCVVQNISAVTGACLVVRKELYEQVGGLDEINLAIAFNDVDFCLKLKAAGYSNVWTPYAKLYHHESYSRGTEDSPEKKARFANEVAFLKSRWGHLLENDPCYNPNLANDREDFTLAWPPRVRKFWI